MLKLLSFLATPYKFLILVCFFVLPAKAQVGFTRGSVFSAIPIQGEVRVECSGFNGEGSAAYTCRDVALSPTAYDHFVGVKDARATRLELISNHEDGSTRSRVTEYSGRAGRTSEAINLWISTLFQKPLLEKGRNRVEYRITSATEVIAQGEIGVEVRRGQGLLCPPAVLKSTDVNDCHSQYSVCQRYFSEHNNCQ